MHNAKEAETYSEADSRIRGMYSYKDVNFPMWTIQASLKGVGKSVKAFVDARWPTNCDRIFPKCWEAYRYIGNGQVR